MSHFVVVGISHKTAPVELRERFSVGLAHVPEWFRTLSEATGVVSGVYLSTCNRAEFYAFLPSLDGELTRLRRFLGESGGLTGSELKERLYVYDGERGIAHLFAVASGLDSQVIGESEILGQVKQAYQTAQEVGWADKRIHRLFQHSFQVAKRIRTETGIGRGLFSVGSAAVALAEKIFGHLSRRRILMIGAGKIGEKTIRHLMEAGADSIWVSSRSFSHAQEVALRLKAEAVPFDRFSDRMREADIVISSTASPHHVIHREMLSSLMRERHHRPLFLIDIAVPRDIDPSVHQLEGVYLYNIDDLEQVVARSRKDREREMEKGLLLAREEARKTLRDLSE